jgi:predicted transposase YbfD/YdcC
VRDHWGVENRLHECLDVTMSEDSARNRADNAPQNLAVLRHMALNVMRKEETKMSQCGKLKKAAWNNSYLVKLLALF